MNRYALYSILFVVLIVLNLCQKPDQEKKKSFSINQITSDYDSLIYAVKVKGDTNAYYELFYGFIELSRPERTDSIIRYSRIMAITYQYERAYFDHLRALCERTGLREDWSSLSDLDLTNQDGASRSIILEWLNKMLNDNIITQKEFDSVKK